MTTQAASTGVQQGLEYILGRVTAYMDARADYFRRFIEGGVLAEGWLPAEVYYALTGRVASNVVRVERLRGRAMGEHDPRQPDLEVRLGGQTLHLHVRPCLVTPAHDLKHHFATTLSPAFQYAMEEQERAAILVVAFPQSIQDEAWKAAVAETEARTGTKVVGQAEFYIPMPPRPLRHGAVSLWQYGGVAWRVLS